MESKQATEQMINQFNRNIPLIAMLVDRGLQATSDKKTSAVSQDSDRANGTSQRTGILHGILHRSQQQLFENKSKEKADETIWSPWRDNCQVIPWLKNKHFVQVPS